MKQIHIFTIFETPKSFYDGQFGYLVDQGNEILLISSDVEDVKDFVEKIIFGLFLSRCREPYRLWQYFGR